eukprot:CAMPEP_0114134050 /NCGR_PEP_ID=MMETSP0043_2-20121206/13949_1 /TAXON_ID=464988 /ORGANISM="Hemiselmis andersenii, Strain CCMP644" /LENGTH=32 /DNA_ID= /DNA_START= /DNA_END= /DNA_ORIENTATION=
MPPASLRYALQAPGDLEAETPCLSSGSASIPS